MNHGAYRAASCLLALATAGCGDLKLVKGGPFPLSAVQPVAVKVRPGDILRLTSWDMGRPQGTNATPPAIEILRLPIRKVAPAAPADPQPPALLPEEAAFLGTVLGARRNSYVQDDQTSAELDAELDKNQIALWNALVDSLEFVKDESAGYGQIAVRMMEDGSYPEGERPGSPFCRLLIDNDGNPTLPTINAYLKNLCIDNIERLREVRSLAPYPRPLLPLATRSATEGYDGYLELDQVVAASGELDRGAVNIGSVHGGEARWTLAGWESSTICRDSATGTPWTIARVRLHTTTGTRQLRVVAEAAAPEFNIHINGLVSPPTGHETVALGDRWVARDKQGNRGTVGHDALYYLYPADIRWVQWRSGGKTISPSKASAEQRAMCFVPEEKP